MTNSQRLYAVRRLLAHWAGDQTDVDTSSLCESVLIRSGFYCGRRFQFGPYHAIWFMEEDQVKIHDPSGQIVATFDHSSIDRLAESASDELAGVEDQQTLSLTHHRQLDVETRPAGFEPEEASDRPSQRRAA